MTTVIVSAQAKRASLLVEKTDKAGRKYIGRNQMVVSAGLLNVKEAERALMQASDESDERVVGLDIQTYGKNEAPESIGYRAGTGSGSNRKSWAGWPLDFLPESPLIRQMSQRKGAQT